MFGIISIMPKDRPILQKPPERVAFCHTLWQTCTPSGRSYLSGRKSGLFSVVMNSLSAVLAAILSRVIFKERLAGVPRQTITQRGLEFVLQTHPAVPSSALPGKHCCPHGNGKWECRCKQAAYVENICQLLANTTKNGAAEKYLLTFLPQLGYAEFTGFDVHCSAVTQHG